MASRLALCALLVAWVWLACAPSMAQAQAALTGPDRFPQFRGLSGLGCGGYGLDHTGRASLAGPVAFTVPTAYVLGHDQVRIGFDTIGERAWPGRHSFSALSSGEENGTLTGTFGHTFGSVNVAGSGMLLSRALDHAWNVQAGFIPTDDGRLAWSVGVQDAGGGGGSSGEGEPGDSRSSRSVFVTTTLRALKAPNDVYLTAGWGTRRFANGFAAASCRVAPAVRLWAEYDGLGLNAGVHFAWHFGRHERPQELNATVGLVDGRLFTLGAGFGF